MDDIYFRKMYSIETNKHLFWFADERNIERCFTDEYVEWLENKLSNDAHSLLGDVMNGLISVNKNIRDFYYFNNEPVPLGKAMTDINIIINKIKKRRS